MSGARKRTRTSKAVRPLEPESSASASSAIRAQAAILQYFQLIGCRCALELASAAAATWAVLRLFSRLRSIFLAASHVKTNSSGFCCDLLPFLSNISRPSLRRCRPQRLVECRQAYDEYLNFEGQILDEDAPSDWVLAHLWVARALARMGDARQSVRRYDVVSARMGQSGSRFAAPSRGAGGARARERDDTLRFDSRLQHSA
jgi:hypothetical protein